MFVFAHVEMQASPLLSSVLFLLSIAYLVDQSDRRPLTATNDTLSSLHVSTCFCSISEPTLDICLVNGYHLLDQFPHSDITAEWRVPNSSIHARAIDGGNFFTSRFARASLSLEQFVEACRALCPDIQLELRAVQECYSTWKAKVHLAHAVLSNNLQHLIMTNCIWSQIIGVKPKRYPYPQGPRPRTGQQRPTAACSPWSFTWFMALSSPSIALIMLHYTKQWYHASTWWLALGSICMPLVIIRLLFMANACCPGLLHALVDWLLAYILAHTLPPSCLHASILAWGCICVLGFMYCILSICIKPVTSIVSSLHFPWKWRVHDTILLGSDLSGKMVKLYLKDASVLQLYLLVCSTLASMYPHAPDHVWEQLSLWHDGRWISDQLDATLYDVGVRPGDVVKVSIGRMHKGMIS